jgi:hypothetical protein
VSLCRYLFGRRFRARCDKPSERTLAQLQDDVTKARHALNKAERALQEHLTREAEYRAALYTWQARQRLDK